MHRSSPVLRRVAAGILAAAVAAAFLASRLPPPRPALAADPVAATPSPSERIHGELHERYAVARLRLAEAKLARAEALTGTVPRQVSDLELASLRRRVGILERHVSVARERPHGNGFELARAAAEAAEQQAAEELAAVRSANARQSGTVSAATIRQLEAAVELARVRLAIWNDPAFLESPLQVIQMQLDQLADEVLELIDRVDNRTSRDRR